MASPRDIRAGRAFIEITTRDNKLAKGLRAASQKLQAFGAGVQAMGLKLVAVGGAILAPLIGAVRHFASVGDQLQKMSARTGVSTEALSELGFATEQSGSDLNTFEKGLVRMQANLVEAAHGSRTAQRHLDELGLTVEDLAGLAPDEQFKTIADRLARIEDPTRKAAVALGLFGRSGQKLIPLMSAGRAGIEELQEEARRLGLSVGPQAARAAAEYTDAWNRLVRTFKAAVFVAGGALAPALTDVLGIVTRYVVGIIDWIKQHQALVVTVFQVAAAVGGIGGVLVAVGAGIQLLAFAFGGLATVAGTIAGLIGAVISPVGALTVAMAALGAAIVTYTAAGGEAVRWLGDQFVQLRDFATAAFGGITNALAAGDTELAARILWLSLKAVWQQGVGTLEKLWTQFQGDSLSLWEETTSGIAMILTDAWLGLQSLWEDVTFKLAKAWEQFTALVVVFWNKAAGLVQKGLVHLRGFFDDSVDVEAEIKQIEEASLAAQRGSVDEAKAVIETRQQERDAAKQAIEQERQARQDVLAESLNAALKAQESETNTQLAQTESEIAEARKELDQLLAEARKKRELTEEELASSKPGDLPGVPKIPTADELTTLADEKLSVTGTFNAAVAERLGAQGNEPVVRVMEEVRELNRQILGEARDGGIVFA